MRFNLIQPAAITWRDDVPQHVFINENNLIKRFRALGAQDTFVIGELGFGAGLNCLLAWQLFLTHAPKNAKLMMFSAEKNPLVIHELTKILSYWPTLTREASALKAAYPILIDGIHPLFFEEGRVVLNLMLGAAETHFNSLLVCGKTGLEAQLRPWQVDAWFLDGFSPAKNPELCSFELFNTLGLLSSEGTTCATLSVAGDVQRHLDAGEFKVQQGVQRSLKKPHTPWAVCKPIKPQKKQAVIVGAGLAGCFTAYALAKRGWQVQVLDSAQHVGAGASGVERAVLYPDLSVYRSPVATWMLNAFLFAKQQYASWLKQNKISGELNGILQFPSKQASFLAKPVDAERASCLAGVQIKEKALFISGAGWLDTRALCKFLINIPGIDFQPNTTVHDLAFDVPVVILANGTGLTNFSETQHFPLALFRGQMTAIQSNTASEALKLPLCGSGHILPESNHMHWLGASYQEEILTQVLTEQDNLNNLAKLSKMPVQAIWSNQILDAWVGVRAKTPDYLPLVGPVPDKAAFQTQFMGLAKDAKRFIASPGVYHPGLYVCAGFGSRGLTSAPLAAEHLASIICNEPPLLSQSMIETLAPARFLVKSIEQGGL
ncbi:MAG: FAD-dependent 5-carboxymethylaminomethyl-2-thiouridine(34) oxidoreductase MnmC [Gammaproteobacteria bacterium]|nr:FAD-dependent 5-carboxymethylaminomethyl-2-thiouridine(34) oxidoreductase MnmC [Gammaproteobacteria bacterium]MCH9717168.1 FAD-dependent 5-carboxymethylaminomethyl-2-thiouridine(34) oxidoreductase MnmC [Gammaproteobacteria bacterium]MCH9763717.1 FAD-dependent 5-carboxymethylaminomethyl-2-thiouridine(34) oxidoreductase MnmC [Gammaproteobacteria bacterium]